MNKPVNLGLSIFDLSKTVMYEFWYDYVKPKDGENAKLCYMNTDSFIVHVKTGDIYEDIAEDVRYCKICRYCKIWHFKCRIRQAIV